MESKRFVSWLQNILHTQNEEISCSECFDLVSSYVDIELSGADASISLQRVKQHLNQCPACREEYEALHDLRRAEEEQDIPSVDDLRDLIH